MKNLIKIVFLLTSLSITHLYAQTNFPKDGDNILNPNLDKFIGTWHWEDNGKSFTIILKKENIKPLIVQDIRADALIGFHKYSSNGVDIENTLQYSNTNYNDKKSSIITFGNSNIPNVIKIGISHSSKNKTVSADIEYIDANHIKIINIENTPGLKINLPGKPPYDWSITLPKNIVLTKQ